MKCQPPGGCWFSFLSCCLKHFPSLWSKVNVIWLCKNYEPRGYLSWKACLCTGSEKLWFWGATDNSLVLIWIVWKYNGWLSMKCYVMQSLNLCVWRLIIFLEKVLWAWYISVISYLYIFLNSWLSLVVRRLARIGLPDSPFPMRHERVSISL